MFKRFSLRTIGHFFARTNRPRPLATQPVTLMYMIQNLAEHLAKINSKRAAAGDPLIKGNKWADFIPGTRQVWFTMCLPKARTGAIEGMPDKDKALELLAAVNGALKKCGLSTIQTSAIIELAEVGK